MKVDITLSIGWEGWTHDSALCGWFRIAKSV